MLEQNTSKGSDIYRIYRLAQKDIKGFYKSILLIVILAAIFAFFSLLVINTIKNFTLFSLISSVILGLLGFALLTIFALSAESKYIFFGLIIFSFSFFLPIFLFKFFEVYLWYVILSVFILLGLYCLSIKGESNVLINLNWPRIVKKGSIFLSWAVVILLIFFFFFVFTSQGEEIKNKLSGGLDFVLSRFIKTPEGITFSGTVDDLLKGFIAKQKVEAPEKTKKTLEESLLKETKAKLSDFLSVPLKGDEKISLVLIDSVFNKWQTLSPVLKWVFYFIIFLILYSLVSLFNFVFSYIVIIFSWMMKEILVSLKIVRTENKGIEKEFLTLE